MLAVVALGGNAILRRGEKQTAAQQFRNTLEAMKTILSLIKKYNIVLTHGNAPQIGSLLIRSEAAANKTYSVPLHVAVAESEGEMGYMIEQSLYNVLSTHHIHKPVISVLTQVIVDKNDPLFKKPTKPVGPYYPRQKALAMMKRGMHMVKINGGYRRVVPSPRPLTIVEAPVIKKLTQDAVVIAAGGGGIPVYKQNNRLKGIDAVIDKDLASACLAKSIGADYLIVLTDVPYAYLHYRTKKQKPLRRLTTRQAEQYVREGHFPPGSMGPKVEAAVQFVRAGGKKAIITNHEQLERALAGKAGTVVVK